MRTLNQPGNKEQENNNKRAMQHKAKKETQVPPVANLPGALTNASPTENPENDEAI